MPATKTIQIKTWKSFRKLYRYLQNKKHPNHAEYDITRMQSAHPEFTARMLRKEVEKTFRKIGGEKRIGAPIQILFTLHISRMPALGKKKDKGWLTPEERDEYARRYIAAVAPDGLALYCWHQNRGSGEDDLNVLVANITSLEQPRSRRRSDINHVDEARDAADEITNVLNAKRRDQGRPRITTMPERMRQIAAKKRGASMEQELALHPQAVYLANLRKVLEEYGHEVTRCNPYNDTISIRFRHAEEDEEKATKRRAKRYKVTALLADVARLRQEYNRAPEPLPQITPEQARQAKQSSAFRLPRDKDLDRLVKEWAREQNPPQPRRPEPPPQEPPQAPRSR